MDGLLVAIAAAGLALAIAASWRAQAEARVAREKLVAVRREIAGEAARLRALEAGRAVSRRGSAPQPTEVIALIAAVLPPDVRLRQLTLDVAGGAGLTLRFQARTAASWDRLFDALAASPHLADVTSGPESREGGPLEVSVRARWAAGQP